MYFILKNATFSNAIGTIPVQEGNVGGGGSGGSTTPTNVTFTINPTPSNATVKLTASGYTQSGNSITVLSGTKVNYTVSASGYTSKSGSKTVSYTQSLGVVLNAEGSTPVNPPSGSGNYNNVSYWVRQSISNTGVIETPETAGYTRSNIMAINKFTKAITLKGTSEQMYFAKVSYDANGNFLARSSWDTPEVGATVTYSDTNPFNVVIATKATTNYDLTKMVSIIDVRDA